MRKTWLPAAFVAAMLALGLLAFGWMTTAGSSEAQAGSMHNCPPSGKWSIAVWEGDSGAAADAALATCGAGTVAAAYSLDPQTGGWSRWFAGKPDVSNLPPLSDLQGVLALGAAGVFVLRRKYPPEKRPYHVPGYPWVPIVFVAVATWFVGNTLVNQTADSMVGLLLILAGVPFYMYWKKTMMQSA